MDKLAFHNPNPNPFSHCPLGLTSLPLTSDVSPQFCRWVQQLLCTIPHLFAIKDWLHTCAENCFISASTVNNNQMSSTGKHAPEAHVKSKLSLMRCLSVRDTLLRNLLGWQIRKDRSNHKEIFDYRGQMGCGKTYKLFHPEAETSSTGEVLVGPKNKGGET